MSSNSRIKKFGKLIGGFSFGVFLNQGISLIMIPLFWTVLKPEDFGIIAVSQMVSYFLSPVYMMGASETIQRFYYKWSDEERPHYLSSFFWFIFIFSLSLTLLIDLVGDQYSHYVIHNINYAPLLQYTVWSAFFVNLMNIPLAIARIKQSIFNYNILLTGSFLTQISIVFYMVKVRNLGSAGYIEGFFIANCIWFIPTLIFTFRNCPIIPKKGLRKIPLRYAAPLSLAGVVDGLSTTLDRFFLDKFVPLSTIGFYNLGRQFGSVVNVINSVTKLIAVPLIYKNASLKSDTKLILSHAGLIYAVVMLIPVVAVCTLSNEFIKIFDPTNVYLEITSYIPFFAISFYFVCLSTITGRGMDLVGVTNWSFIMPLSGAIVSLLSYSLLLPAYGVWGIVWGMFLGALARNLIYIILANYYYPRPLYILKTMTAWAVAYIIYKLTFLLSSTKVEFVILYKISLILMLTLFCWYMLNKHIKFIFKTENK